MKVNTSKIVLYLFVAWTSLVQVGWCQGIFEEVHLKANLPAKGKVVQHPKNKNESFYVVNQGTLSPDRVNRSTTAALYHSTDEGQTWTLLNNQFKIAYLFIHPDTGHLFAIAGFTLPAADRNGFLTELYTNKIITSSDGRNWKDITGKKQYIADTLTLIAADREHPGRVIVYGFEGFRLVPVDAGYTDWSKESIRTGVSVGF